MQQEELINELVRKQIEKDHQLEEQTGGSGHLSFVSCHIDEIIWKKRQDKKLEIQYAYHLIIETEFTCEPDNPPHRSYYKKTIISELAADA
jgi:metal-responsive CopG/Arc/MetJ family transcriptional regulator